MPICTQTLTWRHLIFHVKEHFSICFLDICLTSVLFHYLTFCWLKPAPQGFGKCSCVCKTQSSVSLLQKLLLCACEQFIEAPFPVPFHTQLNILENDQDCDPIVIKVSGGKESHWYEWSLLGIMPHRALKRLKKSLTCIRMQIVNKQMVDPRMESFDLCPFLTGERMRWSRLIRVPVGLRFVKAGWMDAGCQEQRYAKMETINRRRGRELHLTAAVSDRYQGDDH